LSRSWKTSRFAFVFIPTEKSRLPIGSIDGIILGSEGLAGSEAPSGWRIAEETLESPLRVVIPKPE